MTGSQDRRDLHPGGPRGLAFRFLLASLPALAIASACTASTTPIAPKGSTTLTPSPRPTQRSSNEISVDVPQNGQDVCQADGSCASPANLSGAELVVTVVDEGSNPLSGAWIVARGPAVAFGPSSATGQRTFQNLSPGDYVLEVMAAGRPTVVATLSLDPTHLDTPSRLGIPTVRSMVRVLPAPSMLAGAVRDASGKALKGIRVVAGLDATMTDASGSWQVPVRTGISSARILGVGHVPADSPGGTVVLEPASISVSLQNWPFGEAAPSRLNLLQAALASTSVRLSFQEAASEQEASLVRWWAAPNTLSAADRQLMARTLAAGGIVVVSADWGGASGFGPVAVNDALRPFGAYIRIDLVRTGTGVAATSLLEPSWTVERAPSDAVFSGGCTVQAAPPSEELARWPDPAYRVASLPAGERLAAVARQVGPGRLVVVGDTDVLWPKDAGQAPTAAAALDALIRP